jgi:hypothetical protein
LKTNDNSESEEEQEIAPPKQIEDNLRHYLGRMNHFAVVFKSSLSFPPSTARLKLGSSLQ